MIHNIKIVNLFVMANISHIFAITNKRVIIKYN